MDARIFGVNAMVADMEPLLHRLTPDTVELAIVQAAGLWPVAAQPGLLEEVFLALAVDACDAMAAGGTLRVETANLQLDAAYAARHPNVVPGDYVMMAVANTGRGLSESVKNAVRGHGRREGLGIRLAFELAERTGGHVELAEAGGGTMVKVFLPRAGGSLPAGEAGAAAGLPAGTETILLVEDEKALMNVASRVLARLGYSVLLAASGEAALAQARQHDGPIHLLLTDLVLPGMDGVTLAKQLRTLRPEVRVLYMSGFSEDVLRLRGAAEPGFVLLEKPFTLEGLASNVRAALR